MLKSDLVKRIANQNLFRRRDAENVVDINPGAALGKTRRAPAASATTIGNRPGGNLRVMSCRGFVGRTTMIQWSEMTYEQKLIYLRQELVRLKIFAQDVIQRLEGYQRRAGGEAQQAQPHRRRNPSPG
jgi:hypothetical protein